MTPPSDKKSPENGRVVSKNTIRVDRITDRGLSREKFPSNRVRRKLATCKNLAARSESIPSRDRKGRG